MKKGLGDGAYSLIADVVIWRVVTGFPDEARFYATWTDDIEELIACVRHHTSDRILKIEKMKSAFSRFGLKLSESE